MAIDYEKLQNLGYTAHEHMEDFEEKLEDQGIRSFSLSVEKNYDGEVPVFEAKAHDYFTGEDFSESYRLEGVTPEEFEEVMYGIWEKAFHDLEP